MKKIIITSIFLTTCVALYAAVWPQSVRGQECTPCQQFGNALPQPDIMDVFRKALDAGRITEKKKDLWNFVLSAYGSSEFSTKQLERDFGSHLSEKPASLSIFSKASCPFEKWILANSQA